MVIIAMTIERMSVVWEERGATDAMREGMGSLLVAIAAYIFMGIPWLEHLIFTFPELLLVVLALVFLPAATLATACLSCGASRPWQTSNVAGWQKLRQAGVLGLNERNADYIMRAESAAPLPAR